MSTFKVGQRVRMARPVKKENLGLEGRIRAIFPETPALGGPVNCFVDWDRASSGNASHTEQLEPIVPPHEASQYSYTELMDRLKAGEGVPA